MCATSATRVVHRWTNRPTAANRPVASCRDRPTQAARRLLRRRHPRHTLKAEQARIGAAVRSVDERLAAVDAHLPSGSNSWRRPCASPLLWQGLRTGQRKGPPPVQPNRDQPYRGRDGKIAQGGVPAAVRRALQRVAVRIRRSGGLHETELEPEPNNSAANWRERERI